MVWPHSPAELCRRQFDGRNQLCFPAAEIYTPEANHGRCQ